MKKKGIEKTPFNCPICYVTTLYIDPRKLSEHKLRILKEKDHKWLVGSNDQPVLIFCDASEIGRLKDFEISATGKFIFEHPTSKQKKEFLDATADLKVTHTPEDPEPVVLLPPRASDQ